MTGQNFQLEVGENNLEIFPNHKMKPYGYDFKRYWPHMDGEPSFFAKVVALFKCLITESTWISMYSIWHTEINVNDEISILGILKFDADSNLYFMDKPIAVVKNDVSDGLESLQNELMKS